MVWGEVLSSTRLTESPFLTVTLFCRKSAPPICTVGPATAALLSLIVQAANKIVNKPNTTVANNTFLYMFRNPFTSNDGVCCSQWRVVHSCRREKCYHF